MITVVLTALVTALVFILLFNLKSPGKRIEHEIEAKHPLTHPEVQRSIGELLGPPLLEGNRIRALHNGDEIFPAMLEAIRNARTSITFESFIYWKDEIGDEFSDALAERARAGVAVSVLLDWVGSREFCEKHLQKMKQSGVQVRAYRPLRWYNLSRLNNRTHRKILVIDGQRGFTGGVGIADQWKGRARNSDEWRDSHFFVEGPVVAQLQAAFTDNWLATHPMVPHGASYFPPLETLGAAKAQVFKSSPEEGSGSVRLMYLYSMAHAQKSILIANSYFAPDRHVLQILVRAARKGVKIRVILPGPEIDTPLTRRVSRASWGPLLEAGIEISEYQPTMFHCKYMIVDGVWVSVGSTNLDNRSFRLNDECNLNVIDSDFAAEMTEVFEKDRQKSKQVTLKDWQNRPLWEKALEKTASLLHSQV